MKFLWSINIFIKSRRMICFFFFAFLFITTSLYSQQKSTCYLYDAEAQPVDMFVDIINLKAELSFEPEKSKVNGISYYTFQSLRYKTDSIVFDIPDIDIFSAEIDGDAVKYKEISDKVIVYPGANLQWHKQYELKFKYSAVPTAELHFIGWDDPKGIKRKQIWGHNPNHWIPYINQKHDILTSELIVTFDKNFKVYSNGERISVKDNNDGTLTWHYKLDKPHVVYLMVLVIGDYEYKSSVTKSGVPLELWYYPDQEDHFKPTYQYTAEMFDFFEEEFGAKYPWPLYREAPVIDYLFGAMETTTSTIYGDFLQIDARGYWGRNFINVNAHELCHQWFGNYVSHLNNRHTWLTESFATYYAKLFEKKIFGEDYYQNVRRDELERTLSAAEKNDNPVMFSHAGTDRWYPKGSLVLDMLRNVMGDEEFKYAINYYLKKNAHQVVETNDLLKAIRESTGMAMDWFFDEWIYRGGEPHYEVTYKEINNAGISNTHFYVKQIQPTNNLIKLFKMPVEFEVYYTDGSFNNKKVWIENDSTEVIVNNRQGKKIAFTLFDPGRKIIKRVTFKKNINELLNQSSEAPNMIDRYDALIALREYPEEAKREKLQNIYNNESFFLNKSEIIFQLANDSDVSSQNLILNAISDKDAYVRNAVLQSVLKVPEFMRQTYETLLKDSSYFNVELALVNLVNSFPQYAERYLDITKNEEGWRGKNIRIRWLEVALIFNHLEYLDELIDYSSRSYEFETRINALTALKNLNYLDNRVIKNLFEAYLYWNTKLSRAAGEIISFFVKQDKYKEQIMSFVSKEEWKPDEQILVSKILNR